MDISKINNEIIIGNGKVWWDRALQYTVGAVKFVVLLLDDQTSISSWAVRGCEWYIVCLRLWRGVISGGDPPGTETGTTGICVGTAAPGGTTTPGGTYATGAVPRPTPGTVTGIETGTPTPTPPIGGGTMGAATLLRGASSHGVARVRTAV